MNRFCPNPTAPRLRSVAAMSTLLFIGLWARGATAQTAAPTPTPPLEGQPAAAPPRFVVLPQLVMSQPSAAPDPHDVELDRQLADSRAVRGARRMETAGLVLSLIGVGGAVTGGVLFATAETKRDDFGFSKLPGVILTGTSLTILATGIPIWIVGAVRSSKATASAAPASLRVGSSGTGVWVSGSF